MKRPTNRFGFMFLVASFGLVGPVWAESSNTVTTIPLWPDGPLDDNGLTGKEEVGACTGNISRPTLTVHLPPKDKAT